MFNCKNCSRKEPEFDMPITISEEKIYKQILEENNYDPPNTSEIISHLNVRPDVFGMDIIEQLLPLYQQITFPTQGTDEYDKLMQDARMGPYISEFERQLSKCKLVNNIIQQQDLNPVLPQTKSVVMEQQSSDQYVEMNEDMTYKPKNRTLSNGNRSDEIVFQKQELADDSNFNITQQIQEPQTVQKVKTKSNNYELNKTTKMLLQEYQQLHGSEFPIDQDKFHQFMQQKLAAQASLMNEQTVHQILLQENEQQNNIQQNNNAMQNLPILMDEQDPEHFEIPIVNMTSRSKIKRHKVEQQAQQSDDLSQIKISQDINKSQTNSIEKLENSLLQNQQLSVSSVISSKNQTGEQVIQSMEKKEDIMKNSKLERQFKHINDLMEQNNELINDFPNMAFAIDMHLEDLQIELTRQNAGSHKFIFKTEGQNLIIEYIDYTYIVPLIPSNFVYNEKDMTLSIYAHKHGKLSKIVINDPLEFYWQVIKREILRAFGDGGYQNV